MTLRRRTAAILTVMTVFGVTACQAPPAAPVPLTFELDNGAGHIYFNAPIATGSRDVLITDIEQYIKAGARTIRLAINSPGGDVDAAQGIVDYMRTTHATRGIDFETYSVGLVASAATYVFLNAQRRYALAGSGFLFHAAGVVSSGAVSAERLREQANRIEDYERSVRAVLKSRTRLTDAAIDVYLHRTVVLSADDAKRDGVVDGIGIFPTKRVIVISVRRQPAQPARAPSPGPGGP